MNEIDKYLFTIILPTVVALSLIEAFFLTKRHAYDWMAAGISFLDLVLRISLQMTVRASIATPFVMFAFYHRLGIIKIEGIGAALLLFFGQEFCYYWYHRAAHRINWFWCNHAVHHSPNELNLSAAYRIGVVSHLTGTALFFIPLIWLGFNPRLVFQVLTLNLLYQFWIHATWIPKLGWLEYVLNTPSAHRVHHAANLEYLDANYGGVLIIFDRLFGTYLPEREDLPCRYGLVEPMQGYNFLKLELLQWGKLLKNLCSTLNPLIWLGYLLKPPGWQPHSAGETTEDLRRQALTHSLSQAKPLANTI